jgi:hypothetical protein
MPLFDQAFYERLLPGNPLLTLQNMAPFQGDRIFG